MYPNATYPNTGVVYSTPHATGTYNTYPVVGQPQNVTQTGYSMEQLRADLANLVYNNANNDVLAYNLAAECMQEDYRNAKMFKLTKLTQVLSDYLVMTGQMTANQSIQYALNEVYNCAWANMANIYPQFLNDPSLATKHELLNQWNTFAMNRRAELERSGMLEPQAPMNVGPAHYPPSMTGSSVAYNTPNYRMPATNTNSVAAAAANLYTTTPNHPVNNRSVAYGVVNNNNNVDTGRRSIYTDPNMNNRGTSNVAYSQPSNMTEG